MQNVASIVSPASLASIDSAAPFIVEEFTPLFHTPVYRTLPAAARLRYNQLHALYFNEQVAFFEQEMLSPALQALLCSDLPASLAEDVRTFFDEEQHHTAMFRSLNERCAPEIYAGESYYFIQAPHWTRALIRKMSRRPTTFPLVLWLALLQEERSLYYSKECLAQADELEPSFVATHRAHLADEVGHIGWDEELLDWLWPRVSAAWRTINVRLLNWMLGEFFFLPKRSGRNVVGQLAAEFPELDPRALMAAMTGLESNAAYRAALYSREVTPRTFARFDASPEFALLARTLPGYVPKGSAS